MRKEGRKEISNVFTLPFLLNSIFLLFLIEKQKITKKKVNPQSKRRKTLVEKRLRVL